jgi:2,5-diketo-D-gluconate reductase A
MSVPERAPTVRLNDGVAMPVLGFGTWQVTEEDAFHAALEVGYRSIDTAAIYRNEAGVGRALRASGIPRDELFVTTKVWNSDQGYEATLRALDKSLGKLGLDFVDLYLIHWPVPASDRYVDTWRAFEALRRDGKVRSIGVSNFLPRHLERLLHDTDVVPSVNQIELHPRYARRELESLHRKHGIVTEAWSPIAQGGDLLAAPEVTAVARRVGKTPAQVVIPRSKNRARIAENFALFDFALSAEDVAELSAMDLGGERGRIGPDPETFEG